MYAKQQQQQQQQFAFKLTRTHTQTGSEHIFRTSSTRNKADITIITKNKKPKNVTFSARRRLLRSKRVERIPASRSLSLFLSRSFFMCKKIFLRSLG